MANIITSADMAGTLAVDNLYPSGFMLEGFTAANIFDAATLNLAETVMGIDGKLSAGAVLDAIDQTWHFMPDSPTYTKIQNWATVSRTSIATYRCNGSFIFPTSGKKFTCVNGVLVNAQTVPSAGRTLQPITVLIRWESIIPSEYTAS